MSSMHQIKPVTRMTEDAWRAQAVERFGADPLKWRFVCPSCGHVAAVQDWRAAGAPEGSVAFSCVGRYTGDRAAAAAAAFKYSGGPCNYTSGGLFIINKVFVTLKSGEECPVFEVAEIEQKGGAA
ncbi:VVA0879 family protein [Paucibacter sp. Y2R2-4]|uniref:VVA0879 family protein n=1 Tax=Paucibacter sp. Y2R2-4 TaxID=2893553 RepID=UPI0021E35F0E|nr:VVA0879 family protein [Paucibacter sp. Y2R2-4]MCV2349311.1 hypothetical protein [Paucibacter sp. Y2R2-4]